MFILDVKWLDVYLCKKDFCGKMNTKKYVVLYVKGKILHRMTCFSVKSLVKSEILYSEMLFHSTPFIRMLFTLSFSCLNSLCPQFEHNWIDWLLYNIYSAQQKWFMIEAQRARETEKFKKSTERKWDEYAENKRILVLPSFTALFLISYYDSIKCWKTGCCSPCCALDAGPQYGI